MALGIFLYLWLYQLYNRSRFSHIESNCILYGSVAFFGMLLWLVWQLLIFNNPLYFLGSIYSSHSQTMAGVISGNQGLVYYRHLGASALGYLVAMIHNIGLVFVALGFVSGLSFLLHFKSLILKKSSPYQPLFIALLFIPFLFLVYTIYRGNVPLVVPEFNHGGTFNIRLGLYMLPSIIVLIILLLHRISPRLRKILIVTAVCLQFMMNFSTYTRPVTYVSALEAFSEVILAGNWIKNNYQSGYILTSSAIADPLMFNSGLHLNQYLTDGSGPLFLSALSAPARYVKYIAVSNSRVDQSRDLVYQQINTHPDYLIDYRIVYSNQIYRIYQRIY